MDIKVEITITENQISALKKAFPELTPDFSAEKISSFATKEFIELISGKKRYLSLSHQYIEWLEQINIEILPSVEFSPSRIMNQFNFPPGSASYISRILRDRQHTVLIDRAKISIKEKFKEVIDLYEALPAKDRGIPGQLHSLSLTKREMRVLQIILDKYELEQQTLPKADRKSINYPDISENRMDFIKIKYSIEVIKEIFNL